MRFASTTAKLTALLFAAIVGPALAMLALMNVVSSRVLRAEDYALIDEVRDQLVSEYHEQGARELVKAINDRLALDPRSGLVLALNRSGEGIIAGNLATLPEDLPARGKTELALVWRANEPPVRTSFEVVPLARRLTLVIGHARRGADQLEKANREGLLLTGLLTLPLALGLTVLLLALVDRRVSQIATNAARIGAGDLTNRFPDNGTTDSFGRLSQALNRMLEQIEALVGELRLVTDSLAHDLRSPITRLQVALAEIDAATDEGVRSAGLARAHAEAGKLDAMLAMGLQISRLEAGIGRDRFQRVAISGLVEDIAEIYGPAAEDRGFTLSVSAGDGLEAEINRELVGQAIGNLIDNALNHAAGANAIRLAAGRENGVIAIDVIDNGPGIRPEDRAEALRRFGRLDPSRGRPGSGLGLALVTATAHLHGGTVELRDAGPGLWVRMTLADRVTPGKGD